MGQPVLLGHHSQRSHERALDRIDRNLRRAVTEDATAQRAHQAADRARLTAAGQESTVTIGNRIDRTEAEIRRLGRLLDETDPAAGTYRRRLELQLDELADRLAYDQAKLADVGGTPHTQATVRPGDLVRVRGQWYPVVRANVKTVTVPGALYSAESRRTQTTPWREVSDHLSRDAATAHQVRQLAASTSQAFPGLRHRLVQLAEALQEDTARGAGS